MRKEPPRPAEVLTEDDRRQMLRWLIWKSGGMTRVAENSSISRVHLSRLLNGKAMVSGKMRDYSVTGLQPDTITKLVKALGVTDQQAWDLLNIPLEIRASWRSLPPLVDESGPNSATEKHILIEQSLRGDLFLPAGFIILVNEIKMPGAQLQVAEIDGVLYALRPEVMPAHAVIRGWLVGVNVHA